jgi:SHS2 domain-containing protein
MIKDGYDIHVRSDDIQARVWGKEEKDIFERALVALAAAHRPDVTPNNNKTVTIRIHIHASDPTNLLERFLSHVIYEGEMHSALFSAMHVARLTTNEIEAELIGKEIDHKEEEIIAVTVSKPGIHHVEGKLMASFALDIL